MYDTAPLADEDWFAALADSHLQPNDGTARSFVRNTEFLGDLAITSPCMVLIQSLSHVTTTHC